MPKKKRAGPRNKPPRNVPAYRVTPRRVPVMTDWRSDGDTVTLTRGTPGPHRESIEAALKSLLGVHPVCPACGSGWVLFVQGPESLPGFGGVERDMVFAEITCAAEVEFGFTAADEVFLHEDTSGTYAISPDGAVDRVLEDEE